MKTILSSNPKMYNVIGQMFIL